MEKHAATLAATGGPDVSYKNLFNPISPITGGGDKYPGFVANMFPNNPRAAWLASKVGAVTLLASLIRPVMTEEALANLSLIGSVLIFCVGLNLVWGKKIRVANCLPAVFLAAAAAFLP